MSSMHEPHIPEPVLRNPRYKDRLLEIGSKEDIPSEIQNTPIASFIMRMNFGWPVPLTPTPQLLIATCIEFRFAMTVPRMYAYVIRRASGRLIGSEFTIGYCLAQGVDHILMIGHNDCGMTRALEQGPKLVAAYVKEGWSEEAATEFVERQRERYHMADELDGLEEEYHRLRTLFKKVTIAPLFVSLYDSRLYLPKFYVEDLKSPRYDDFRVPDALVQDL